MKKFEIGSQRFVIVKNHKDSPTIIIVESGTKKSAEFTCKRWAYFTRSLIPRIDEAVQQLEAGQEIRYQEHVGGKLYVSVTKGFACVDIRHFYWNSLVGPKPTKTGIALRLREWQKLKELIPEIHRKYPIFEKSPTCLEGTDHANQEGAMNCLECNPYQFEPG